VEVIDDSFGFTPEDQPQWLAQRIEAAMDRS
jgi:hypothetical protein